MSNPYDGSFFDFMTDEAMRSAAVVVPFVTELLPDLASVVDVGCGTGSWGHAFSTAGVPVVLGVDGDYVDRSRVRIPFRAVDLEAGLPLDGEVFDLVVCLEVAEHLRPARAAGFVADLCALAPAVLFGAAVPGQGGTGHVNEQWLGYWVALFAVHGFECVDALRPRLRYESAVGWWYRQNTVLMVRQPSPARFDGFARVLESTDGTHLEYVDRRVLDITGRRALSALVSRLLARLPGR